MFEVFSFINSFLIWYITSQVSFYLFVFVLFSGFFSFAFGRK